MQPFDCGIGDEDGYYFILGRTDDAINVGGHRLGTREIENAVSSQPGIAEAAVVGVADELKGQLPLALAVVALRNFHLHAAIPAVAHAATRPGRSARRSTTQSRSPRDLRSV